MSSNSNVYTFQGYVSNQTDLGRLLHGYERVSLGEKPATMKDVIAVLSATSGKLSELNVPNMSMLGARDQIPDCTDPPHPGTYSETLVYLSISCAFQPKAQKQVRALADFVSRAERLKKLEYVVSEYPTDEFMRREAAYLCNERPMIQLEPLPSMLGLPTPSEKRETALNQDGRAWGTAFAELVTGRRLLPPPADPVEAAIATVLDQATLNFSTLSLTAPQQQQIILTEGAVRSNALQVMRALDKKPPKHQYMSAEEWFSGIAIVLSRRLPSTITELTLKMIFPPVPSPEQPIRILQDLAALESLALQYCDITDAMLEALMPDLTHMPRLRRLDLARNSLTSRADLGALADGRMPALETLLMQYNKSAGGPAFTGLFEALASSGNPVLREIDVSHNEFEPDGLLFAHLAGWRAQEATLVLPNIFRDETVAAIESLMPDGSTLRLEGFAGDPAETTRAAAASLGL